MDEPISVMSWNVNGEIGISDTRMETQLEFLDSYTEEIDVFLFQAVDYERQSNATWGGQLGSLIDFFEQTDQCFSVAHTADWAHELYESTVQPHQDINSPHNRCNLTVSRWPIERRPLSLREFDKPKKLTYYTTHFPEKLLVSTIETKPDEPPNGLELWNVGIINGSNWHEEKVKMLETVYNRIFVQVTEKDKDVILGGDFNAPKTELQDGAIIPYGGNAPLYRAYPPYGDPYYFEDSSEALDEFTFRDRRERSERAIFDPDVGEWEMRDAYWAASDGAKQGSDSDHTHIAAGAPKRLDHVLVSDRFAVHSCELLNDEMENSSGPSASDHAPVVTEISILNSDTSKRGAEDR